MYLEKILNINNMRTIDFYEKMENNKLKYLYKKYEKISENNQLIIENKKINKQYCDKLIKINKDYDIDINLIRMELTKRLWYGKLKNDKK